MSRFCPLFVFLLVLSGCASSPEPVVSLHPSWTFRGIPWGSSPKEIQDLEFEDGDANTRMYTKPNEDLDLDGIPIRGVAYLFNRSSQLMGVTMDIDSVHLRDLHAALTEAYGPEFGHSDNRWLWSDEPERDILIGIHQHSDKLVLVFLKKA